MRGADIDLEVDWPGREGSPAPLEEVLEYCQAAIDGRVEEAVWRHGDSIWRVRGRIDLQTRVLEPTVVEALAWAAFDVEPGSTTSTSPTQRRAPGGLGAEWP